MPFTKQVWQNSPSTATPISAAALNRLENGIDDLYGQLITRTLSYSNGGLGGSVTPTGNPWNSGTAASWRFVVKLPATTTRWRIKLRNYDTPAQATKTTLTGKKIIHGDHNRTSGAGTAGETGSFVGNTASVIVGSDFVVPGDGSWYTSPWVTSADDQFDANREHLIGIAATASSSLSVQSGAGRAWYWTDPATGVDPAIAGSAATNQTTWIPLDWLIEYECTSRRTAYLFVGDSICEGIAGPRGTSGQTPTALWRNYPWQWAARHNALVTNLSLAGITAAYFANPSAGLWTRQDHANAGYDGAVIALGSNDISASRTLTQVQSDILTVIANVRTIIGANKPIYLTTVISRSFPGSPDTRESVRLDYNSWLCEQPTGIAGVIDLDAATRGTSTSALWPTYTCDTIHPSWMGHIRLADAVGAVIP
ncbi:SGNH/GDSL hydrolase family protein [Nocardia transvalensis]|uniref:SGNH/GDSL hydrolase family protein n=1 Tax=Nocardia transvalensis TaxID=37333 RepID=UPI001894B32C|nr:SGNH/GDSL hydrolase family protein [Nocardia transvalensis]MBF6328716.1 SGNH/GDSL hydrolase family protein [Nocardia transvalensis]